MNTDDGATGRFFSTSPAAIPPAPSAAIPVTVAKATAAAAPPTAAAPTVAAPTVAVLMHDGFYSCGTGAGRSNRAFLQVLTRHLDPAVRLAVLPIHLNPDSDEYHAAWHQETRQLIHPLGGRVLPVDNGTAGKARFGGLDAFQRACASAASQLAQQVVPDCGPLLIVAFDCPFYGLATELAPRIPAERRAELVIVARSTAALHAPDDLVRTGWEQHGLQQTIAAGGRVAAISAHMSTHLAQAYQLPSEGLIDLPNGLTREDWRHIPAPDTQLLPAAAHAGFLLAMGRATDYKGFDDLLDALVLLQDRPITVPHTLLAAVTENTGNNLNPHQRHLAERIATENLNITLLPRFQPGLRSLLTHPALAAVVVPSRTEPFGRIPLEAFVAGAAPVVATTAGGLAELVTDQTGFAAHPSDPQSLSSALHQALNITPGDRARLRAAGRRLAASRYDHERTVHRFLTQIAPWALRPQPLQPRPAPTAQRHGAGHSKC